MSSAVLMSSQPSSWTNPTWFASMKHGSHIMLQRLVRSMVSTAPRPYLIVLLPWSWSFSSLCAVKSRPGNTRSRWRNIAGSIDMTSSKCPCSGQSLTIRIVPSRSTICALISPTFSLSSTETSLTPSRISRRASRTQTGQSESVSRGTPRPGLVFSHDFCSGLSDHLGVNDSFCISRLASA